MERQCTIVSLMEVNLHKGKINGVNVAFLVSQSFRKHAETFINVQNAFSQVGSSQGEGHKQAG